MARERESDDEMILRPVSELPFSTQLAVMPDGQAALAIGASCVGQCSKLREKGEK